MKTFSLDEANALIPQLETLLQDMLAQRDELLRVAETLKPMLAHAKGNGGNKTSSHYALLVQHFQASFNLFQNLGCELKDLDQGLVDFPAYRDGKLVYFCWRRGEPEINFWHDVDAGFAGRQPL